MNRPSESILSPIFSSPHPCVFGLLPTVTRTLSKISDCISPSLSFQVSSTLPSLISAPWAKQLVCVTTPFFLNQVVRGLRNSSSKMAMTLSSPSTTVTSLPRRLRAIPNSSPIYPPPITATFSGRLSRSKAPVEEQMCCSSNFMKGNSIGDDPVARMTFSASIAIVPSSVSTVQFLAFWNVAHPLMSSAPALFSRCSTPLLRRSTISSFQETSAGMSSATSPLMLMPICPSLWCAKCSNRSEA